MSPARRVETPQRDHPQLAREASEARLCDYFAHSRVCKVKLRLRAFPHRPAGPRGQETK